MSPTSKGFAKSTKSPIRPWRFPLPLPLLVLSLGGLAAIGSAGAQTPDDYFHFGAQHFIAEQIDKAKEEVAKGLNLAPDHPQLQALQALLEQQQQQQQQQQEQEQQDQENQDEQENGSEDQQQQQNSQEDQGEESEQDQSQQQQQEQSGQEQKEGQEGQEGNQGEEENEASPPQPREAGEDGQQDQENEASQMRTNDMQMIQMNPEEAKRLLDSIKGEEKTLIFLPPQLMTNRNRTLKNW